MVYGMWMMMVLLSVWRQTNFSNFRADTHTHTHKQFCFRRALAASTLYEVLHCTQNSMCCVWHWIFYLHFVKVHKHTHTLCTRVKTKRHTPPWDRAKNAICPNWSVYTWGEKKRGRTNMLKIENAHFIPIALAAPHRSAHGWGKSQNQKENRLCNG